ncbi:hypothetical protein OG604_06310 [Streptomyces sp. NBC_01231]|nr:hypothetical protein OG604_06310 [Streptomyces sp. NBC_01231]
MAGRRLGGLLKALNSLDLGSVPGAVTALLTPALGRGTGLLADGASQLPALPAAGGPRAQAVGPSRRRNAATRRASAAT